MMPMGPWRDKIGLFFPGGCAIIIVICCDVIYHISTEGMIETIKSERGDWTWRNWKS